MDILNTLLEAYVAPEMAAQEATNYKRAEGQRNATAMQDVLNSMNAPAQKPVSYEVQPTSKTKAAGAGDILNALTQSPEAKAMQASQKPDMTPLQRQRALAIQMISSPNKYVQEQGFDMLSKYQATVTADNRTSAIKDYEYSQAQDGAEPVSFSKWKTDQKSKMFEAAGDKPMLYNELSKYMTSDGKNLPYGTTPNQAKEMGVVIRKNQAVGDAGKTAMLSTAESAFPIIDEYMFDDNGEILESVMYGISAIDNLPLGLGNIGTKFLAPDTKKVYNAFELGMQAITRTETGAAMPPEEIDNTKARFMPKPTDTDEVKRQKLKAYKYFITHASDLIDPTRAENKGLTPSQRMKKAEEKAFKSVNSNLSNSDVPPPPGVTWVEE